MNITQLEKKFQQWSAMCDVPVPSVKVEGKAPRILGGIIQGQYNPHLNFITLYEEGMEEKVAKHEFIHYLRRQMGLNKDMTLLFNMGISKDKLTDLHDYEEGRTYYLTEQSWPTILKDLKEEKKQVAINEDNKGNFIVDEGAILNERMHRTMASILNIFPKYGS